MRRRFAAGGSGGHLGAMNQEPFNPLSYESLGASVVRELTSREVHPLPPTQSFPGAGIYAIYTTGASFEPYWAYGQYNAHGEGVFELPIYVGKAVPKGSRMGTEDFTGTTQPAIYSRLCKHARTIAATNLDPADFACRFLVVAPAWIGLAEQMMIREYRPLWNSAIDGFGNNDPGAGRYEQQKSRWDILHPGRPWASRCATPTDYDEDSVANMVREYLSRTLLV
jgi:hypothetical protein